MSRTFRSPDGRSWTLERERPKSMLASAKDGPVFWGSVIVTVVILAAVVWITIEFGVGAIFVITLVLLLIWLVERGFNAVRPNLKAHTDGPPAQTLTWRTTHRYGLSRIEDRIVTQIENGRLEEEPPGSVLIGI